MRCRPAGGGASNAPDARMWARWPILRRAVIFYQGDEEKRLAEESKGAIEQSGRLPGRIVTELTLASTFYPAEDYHQDFYKKNPVRYKFYKYNCGRAQRLEDLWGAP